MVDTNTALINLAQNAGFEPHDLLPIFRASSGVDHSTTPDRFHPDPIIHAAIAQYLAKILD